jgi:hypothetical protein
LGLIVFTFKGLSILNNSAALTNNLTPLLWQMIEKINWMADQSEKGIEQSGGIMVNYLYRYVFIEKKKINLHTFLMAFMDTIDMFRLENIEEYAQSYSGTGHIHTSPTLSKHVKVCYTLAWYEISHLMSLYICRFSSSVLQCYNLHLFLYLRILSVLIEIFCNTGTARYIRQGCSCFPLTCGMCV